MSKCNHIKPALIRFHKLHERLYYFDINMYINSFFMQNIYKLKLTCTKILGLSLFVFNQSMKCKICTNLLFIPLYSMFRHPWMTLFSLQQRNNAFVQFVFCNLKSYWQVFVISKFNKLFSFIKDTTSTRHY